MLDLDLLLFLLSFPEHSTFICMLVLELIKDFLNVLFPRKGFGLHLFLEAVLLFFTVIKQKPEFLFLIAGFFSPELSPLWKALDSTEKGRRHLGAVLDIDVCDLSFAKTRLHHRLGKDFLSKQIEDELLQLVVCPVLEQRPHLLLKDIGKGLFGVFLDAELLELHFGDAFLARMQILQKLDQLFGVLDALVLLELPASHAVVAGLVAEPGVEVGFAQIAELELPPAHELLLAVFDHLSQLPVAEVLGLARRVAVAQVHALQSRPVAPAVEEHALCHFAVSARPAALLVVVFERLGQRVVDHEPDIRFVDAHSEGDGGDDDVDSIVHPLLLNLPFLLVADLGVVEGSLVAPLVQVLAHFLAVLATEAVDDARLPLVRVQDAAYFPHRISGLAPNFVVQVGAVEARLEKHAVPEVEVVDDLLLDGFGDCGSEAQNRSLGELLLYEGEPLVLVPEFLSPRRDAVHLVDDHVPQETIAVELVEDLTEGLAAADLLGRAEQQNAVLLSVVPTQFVVDPQSLGLGGASRQTVGLDVVLQRLLLLVVDQRHQRQNAQVDAPPDEGQDLKNQTLASAGGDADERVVALQGAFDDGFLVVLELLDVRKVAKGAVQYTVFDLPVRLPEPRVCQVVVSDRRLLFVKSLDGGQLGALLTLFEIGGAFVGPEADPLVSEATLTAILLRFFPVENLPRTRSFGLLLASSVSEILEVVNFLALSTSTGQRTRSVFSLWDGWQTF